MRAPTNAGMPATYRRSIRRFPEAPTHRYSGGDETACGLWIGLINSTTGFDHLVTCTRRGCS